jgi:hypothetical protein
VRSCREDFSCSVATLAGQIEAAACPGASAPTPRRGLLENQHVPLNLTGAALATAASACRAMAYQERERAKKIENPTMRGPVENAAQRYAAKALDAWAYAYQVKLFHPAGQTTGKWLHREFQCPSAG